MATVAEGRERTEINLPAGVREKIDRLQRRMQKEAETAGIDPGRFKDRGVMVEWLVETVERTIEQRAAVEGALAEADSRLRDADAAEERLRDQQIALDRQSQALELRALELQRQEGLSGWILGLFAELEARGLDRDHVVQLARVMRDSGLEPEHVAGALRDENVGGLLGYSRRIREAVEEGQAAYTDLIERNQALRQANATLQAEARTLEAAITEIRRTIEESQHQANVTALRAQEVGIYVDWMRAVGVERIEDLPIETARILAGTILLAAVGSHGDRMLQIPPGPTMLIGGQILLSEVPYLLAPREAYAEMQQAQQRRQAMADSFAGGGGPAERERPS